MRPPFVKPPQVPPAGSPGSRELGCRGPRAPREAEVAPRSRETGLMCGSAGGRGPVTFTWPPKAGPRTGSLWRSQAAEPPPRLTIPSLPNLGPTSRESTALGEKSHISSPHPQGKGSETRFPDPAQQVLWTPARLGRPGATGCGRG